MAVEVTPSLVHTGKEFLPVRQHSHTARVQVFRHARGSRVSVAVEVGRVGGGGESEGVVEELYDQRRGEVDRGREVDDDEGLQKSAC